ncbi:MAG: hypothetical protein JSV37_00655, partial [Anaerolineaceae bacterium]
HEVGEAVEEFRESLSPDTDLILGATSEESMTGRAQVILIITGIGARPVRTMSRRLTLDRSHETDEPYMDMDNLDLPAFLRKRVSIG